MRDHVPEFKRSEGLNNLGEEFYDNPDSRELQKAASEYINLFVAREKNSPMLGASGAIYGLLIAAGLLFPNTQLMLIIPPMPVKLKYIAFVLGALAIFNAWNNAEGDTTAHFAHLGGMIIGIIVVKIWNKDRSKFF
jgi:membrane associated rhomboid family serine protease